MSKSNMSIAQAEPGQGRTGLVLATLFLGTFVLGSAELLVVGVLDLIAASLRVSIPAAGVLVTAYALGLAVGGPLLTALTIKLDRKTVLVGAVVLFAVANLLPVLVPSYGLFIVVRVVTGACQGLFIAVAFVLGMTIVPPERAGRAISTIVSGIAVSATFGVPLGTLIGHGLGWQGSFVAIIAFALVALVATALVVPSVPSSGNGAAGQARHAFAPRVLAVLGLTFLVFASLYGALTYIVPFLQRVTGISGAWISVFLFIYGLATAVGSFSGGRFADQNAGRTLIVGTAGVAAALLVLHVLGASPVLAALLILVWGLFGSVMTASLQLRVVSLAGPGGQLASALPASAANVGIALGSLAGGMALTGFGASGPVVTGAVIAALGIVVAWATSFLRPPAAAVESDAEAADETPATAA
jgi:DHA1 family inner membrane transport protein